MPRSSTASNRMRAVQAKSKLPFFEVFQAVKPEKELMSRKCRRYYITGAPQCVDPDASLGGVLNSASFDAIYVQFCGLMVLKGSVADRMTMPMI